MEERQNRPSKLEKQVRISRTGSEAVNGQTMASNGELMVAIMGAIAAYIQMEQQTSSNDDVKGQIK